MFLLFLLEGQQLVVEVLLVQLVHAVLIIEPGQ